MNIDTLRNELEYNHEKLRILNANSGDNSLKQKVQNQLRILNFKIEIETIEEKIKRLQAQ